jgi:hypothetical protein
MTLILIVEKLTHSAYWQIYSLLTSKRSYVRSLNLVYRPPHRYPILLHLSSRRILSSIYLSRSIRYTLSTHLQHQTIGNLHSSSALSPPSAMKTVISFSPKPHIPYRPYQSSHPSATSSTQKNRIQQRALQSSACFNLKCSAQMQMTVNTLWHLHQGKDGNHLFGMVKNISGFRIL